MSTDDTANPPLPDTDSAEEHREGQPTQHGPASEDGPQWANDAASVEILLNEDDPHRSVMELLVGDLEGRLGAVEVELGPMEVRALLRQLEDVQLAQEIAEWVAEGRDVEDFPIEGRDRAAEEVDYDDGDEDVDDESVPQDRRIDRFTDPFAVKTWMEQDYRVLGMKVQHLLVGVAVMVGVIMAIVGVIS